MSSSLTPEQTFPLDLDAELSAFVSGGGLRKFPTPGAAIEAGGIMWNVNYKTDDLAKVIARDKELAAEFLRRANSAALARSGGCTSIASAINRLGAEQTAFLLIAHRYGEQIAIDGPLLPLRARIWREGLVGARLCEALAKARRIAEHEGFLCGLNHDIGRAITVGCLEMILMGRRSALAMPERFWTDIVDRHHVSVGMAVAEMWGMTAPIREVIAAHHRDTSEGMQRPELLEIVKVADRVNAALAQTSHLSTDSLAALPGLRASEVSTVAQVIEDLPRFISDMERNSKKPLWGLVPIRALVHHDEWQGEGTRPLQASFTCISAGKRQPYQAKEIAADRLLATGKDPLREGFLTEVSLELAPDARFWAEVACCQKRERLYEVQLRPFALGASTLGVWRHLAPADSAAQK
jgi:HD-like signal output (HDOD) protein